MLNVGGKIDHRVLFTILPQSASTKANYCLERGIMQHSKDKLKVLGYLLDPNLNQVGSHYVCILIFLHPRVCIKQKYTTVLRANDFIYLLLAYEIGCSELEMILYYNHNNISMYAYDD